MKLFNKITEYNTLAKRFTGAFLLINELEQKIYYNFDNRNYEKDILILAYISRKEKTLKRPDRDARRDFPRPGLPDSGIRKH